MDLLLKNKSEVSVFKNYIVYYTCLLLKSLLVTVKIFDLACQKTTV